jgi:outer membrane protein assembly factor BamB
VRRQPPAGITLGACALSVLLLAGCTGTSASPPAASKPRTAQSTRTAGPVAPTATSAPSARSTAVSVASGLARLHPLTGPFLATGSDPRVLPAPVLVADEDNNRLVVVDPQGRTLWEFPRPGDLRPGQTFIRPDDVFFTPDGKQIVATQEENQVVSIIDIATRRIVYRYGSSGRAGSSAGQLSNPDDAMLLPDGRLLIADIRNCRVLFVRPGASAPSGQLGTTGSCYHQPPAYLGSPNGVFPMRDGRYLVTEINGDWVNAMSLNGSVLWSAHPPEVAYPSDTNEISRGRYLTVDYSTPGQIVIFNRGGGALWRYRPSGAAQLSRPSLALPLPNGDVIATDDANHRIIVVDPRTNKVVWQYGHKGIAGRAPGYLANPDGMDLLPPNDLWSVRAR